MLPDTVPRIDPSGNPRSAVNSGGLTCGSRHASLCQTWRGLPVDLTSPPSEPTLRAFTPARLSARLATIGVSVTDRTIRTWCERRMLESRKMAGGWRIPADTVKRLWPKLFAAPMPRAA